MEDIYDDLNNYEDVHALEELRSENKELKVKLEEHSAAMEKLQKEILQDYDNLEIEFKYLEKNYSSLLMTARAELQRKTQRISQLTAEKDLMVLDAFNSGKRIRRNFNTVVNNPGRMKQDKPLEGNNNTKQDNVTQKNVDFNPERCEPPVKLKNETGSDSGTSNTNKSSKDAGVRLKLSKNRKSNVNDSVAQQKTEVNERPKTTASGIKDRRKSLPAVNMPIDTFSSSDELERDYPTKVTRTDNERRNINKLPIERPSNKTSETFSLDDRGHKHHEYSSRDTYKSRSSKQHDSSSFRGWDKYDVPWKYRKQCSPERGQYRPLREHPDGYPKHRECQDAYPKQHREHPDDFTKKRREHPDDYAKKYREHHDAYPKQHREHPDDFNKHERGRYQGRSLESPPLQSYNRLQRTKSAHQSDPDRYLHEPEKNRHYHDDKYSAKYRSKDYDEPQIKRQRTESYGNTETHSMDDKRHTCVSSVESHTPDFSPHDYDMLRFSCQSPDSVHIEGAIANPTKEIMATASTPLDDPRVTSKRYVIRKENGKETLSTAVGRNIDVIPVNKAVWNIKPVYVPVALVRRPSHCGDQLVSDIYMDIQNPVTNLDASMESGVCGTDDEFKEIRSKLKEIQHNTQDLTISKQAPEDISKQPVNAETVSKPNIVKYKIPKIGQINKNTQSKMDVPIIELGETDPKHKNFNKNGAAEDTVPKELLTQNNKHEDFLQHNKKNSKVEDNKKSKSGERGEHQSTLTKIAIVADDLELSDDNSDHMDTGKRIVPEKVQNKCGIPLNMNKGRGNESENNVENKTVVSAHTDIKNTVDTGLKDVAEEEKTKESDSAKKQKAKKKKSKTKEISKDSAESTAVPIHVPEKKPKSKKEKESTHKETKEKFCDLFGDSSSLMTPEDLGIPSYLPISEDAQETVDMKINQIINAAPLVVNDDVPGKMLPQNRVEVTIQETPAHDDIPKTDLEKSSKDIEAKEVVQEIKKKSSKRNEEIIDTNQLPSPIVYENLNPGTDLNDPNVVKTVIISTGKQPEIAYENKIEVTKPDTAVEVNSIQNTKDIKLFPATMELKKDILKALATSTPHKEFFTMNPLEADATKTDIICDPCVSKAVATIMHVEPVVSQTETTTLESNDAPDVRIFVKRRRKVVKRPPMT